MYSAALYGAVAWTVYAIVECLFSSILLWFVKPSYEYIPLHLGLTALLFFIYPAIGSIISALCVLGLRIADVKSSFIKKTQPVILFSSVATLTVVLAFDINLIVNYSGNLSLSELPSLCISLFFIFGLTLSAMSSVWFNRLRFLTNPWTVSAILLGQPWINREVFDSSSLSLKAGIVLVYPVLILLVSFFLKKFLQTHRFGRHTDAHFLSARPLFLYAISGLLVLGFSFFLEQKPYVDASYLSSLLQRSDRPNVILITMDTVRADHLSLYGYRRDTTPNLRKFSEESTLYARAIAPSDITLSTHASIFTGLYPSQHGSHYGMDYPLGRPLSEKFKTLSEILSEQGYLNISVVANIGVLGYAYNLFQGFQYHDPRFPVLFLSPTRPYYLRQSVRNFITFTKVMPTYTFDQRCRRAENINKEVFTLLNKINEDETSFFLFINYMDAHEPYIPLSPFDMLFPGKNEKFTTKHYRQISNEVMTLERNITEKEYGHLISQYDGGIAYIDFHIGELIEKLKKLGLYEKSLIIITSDHGEAFGERNLLSHGVSVYQDQVFVPLIIRYPNITKKNRVDQRISLVDLMPTILDVLKYDMPEDIQGESLLKLQPRKARELISESFPSDSLLAYQKFHRVERTIFSGHFKLISSTAGKRELYDLSKDPNEKKDLYDSNNEVSKELEKKLNKWIESIESVGEDANAPVKLNKDTIERLKSLGYVQ